MGLGETSTSDAVMPRRVSEQDVYERCGDAPRVGLSGTSTSDAAVWRAPGVGLSETSTGDAARPGRGSERNVYERCGDAQACV